MEREADKRENGTGLSSFAITRFVLVALLFAMLMAWLGVLAVAFYTQDRTPIDWGGARWIAPSHDTAVAYFRHSFIAPGTAQEAYLRIGASDAFELYINGVPLADSKFYSSYPTDVIDIAAYIKPGVNVVAIRVVRKTYPGTPELVVNGTWRSGAQSGRIRSDSMWKVVTREVHQLSGEMRWYARDFIDRDWLPATLVADKKRVIVPLRHWFNEALMARFPSGDWVWSQEDSLRATFQREVTLDGQRLHQAWLGISSRGVYTLTVNDVLVVPYAAITHEYLDVYNIAPYLRRGDNTITVDVSDEAPGGRLLLAGAARVDDRWIDFSSDPRWLANSVVFTGERDLQGARQPVKVWSAMQPVAARWQWRKGNSAVNGFPTLRAQDIKASRELTWDEFMRILPMGFTVFATVVGGALVFVLLLGWLVAVPKNALLATYTMPYLLVTIALVFIFLYSFDIRSAINKSTSFNLFFATTGVVSLSLIVMFMEALLRARRLKGKVAP